MIMYIFMTFSIGLFRGRQGMSGVWWNHEMHTSTSTVARQSGVNDLSVMVPIQ